MPVVQGSLIPVPSSSISLGGPTLCPVYSTGRSIVTTEKVRESFPNTTAFICSVSVEIHNLEGFVRLETILPSVHRSTRPDIQTLYGAHAHTDPCLWDFPVGMYVIYVHLVKVA